MSLYVIITTGKHADREYHTYKCKPARIANLVVRINLSIMRLLYGHFFAASLGFSAHALTLNLSNAALKAYTWSNQVLAAHNAARAKYHVPPLSWNSDLYSGVLEHAHTCVFKHSDQGDVGWDSRYGENLVRTDLSRLDSRLAFS
jgi:hypothetical protein